MLPALHIQKRIMLVFGLLICSSLIALFLFSTGLEGGMDSYNHYLIARYSFKHPELLLNYWGKPLYNIVAAPFTQWGLSGSLALNIISLLGASYFSFKIAERLGSKIPLMAFLLCLLSPIFLVNTISSLTEPLNALLLSACIYWFVSGRIQWAAILAGFLPYARSEGFVILAVIAAFLVFIQKDYRAFALLFIGSVVMNCLGWAIEGQPFWIITENPYLKFELSGENVCGSGPIWHYLRWGHITFSFSTCILIVLAYVQLVKDLLRRKFSKWVLLIAAIFAAYFAVHALIWALGMMGSCGYERVMLVIVPLAAVLGSLVLERVIQGYQAVVQSLILLLFIGNGIYAPIKYYSYKFPIQISQEQEEFTKTYQWLRTTEYADRPWAYMYAYLSLIADRDPWDPAEHIELWKTSLPYMEKGTVVIWDAHFGGNESNIDVQDLLHDPNYRLLKSIEPTEPFSTLNNRSFKILVFEKLSEKI